MSFSGKTTTNSFKGHCQEVLLIISKSLFRCSNMSTSGMFSSALFGLNGAKLLYEYVYLLQPFLQEMCTRYRISFLVYTVNLVSASSSIFTFLYLTYFFAICSIKSLDLTYNKQMFMDLLNAKCKN